MPTVITAEACELLGIRGKIGNAGIDEDSRPLLEADTALSRQDEEGAGRVSRPASRRISLEVASGGLVTDRLAVAFEANRAA